MTTPQSEYPEVEAQLRIAIPADPERWREASIDEDDWYRLSVLIGGSKGLPAGPLSHLLDRALDLAATTDPENDKTGFCRFRICFDVVDAAEAVPEEIRAALVSRALGLSNQICWQHGRDGWWWLADILRLRWLFGDSTLVPTQLLWQIIVSGAGMNGCAGDEWLMARAELLERTLGWLRWSLRCDGVLGIERGSVGARLHSHPAGYECMNVDFRAFAVSYAYMRRRGGPPFPVACGHALSEEELDLTELLDPAQLLSILGFHDLLMHHFHGALRSLAVWQPELPASLNAPNFGRPPLHWAARQGAHRCCQVLLEAGAEVNLHERDGQSTPLHLAAREGYVPVCQLLLEAGADPLATDAAGRTPIDLARAGSHDAAAYLLSEARPGGDAGAEGPRR